MRVLSVTGVATCTVQPSHVQSYGMPRRICLCLVISVYAVWLRLVPQVRCQQLLQMSHCRASCRAVTLRTHFLQLSFATGNSIAGLDSMLAWTKVYIAYSCAYYNRLVLTRALFMSVQVSIMHVPRPRHYCYFRRGSRILQGRVSNACERGTALPPIILTILPEPNNFLTLEEIVGARRFQNMFFSKKKGI